MAVTNQEIQSWLAANPTADDRTIAAAMNQYGVTPAQMASATGLNLADVQNRYNAAIAPVARPTPQPPAPAVQTGTTLPITRPVVTPTPTPTPTPAPTTFTPAATGGTPTSNLPAYQQQNQQQGIAGYAQPYVGGMLGATMGQLFNTDASGNITGLRGYTPYSYNPADYYAAFTPMQQQVFQQASQLQTPGQFGAATNLASTAGLEALNSALRAQNYGASGYSSGQAGQQLGVQGGGLYGGMGAGYGMNAADLATNALGYGNLASQIGQMGLQAQQTGQSVTRQARDYAAQQAAAGQNYALQATSPEAISAYMSPYMQNVVDVQQQQAKRQAAIAGQTQQAEAVKAGAFGGARDAIQRAQAAADLQRNLANIQATGTQTAYQQALQNMQYGSNLGLQGLAGAQTGLGTALQGGQLGLSGIGQALSGQQAALQGVGAANQAYQTGIQGAQAGLQGVQQQLAGTAQGMQGAAQGMQGVSGAQAGYGLAGQQAGTLGQLGTAQNQTNLANLGFMNTIGQQQQKQQQDIINQAVQNYQTAQQYPYMQLGFMQNMLQGLPVTTTAQQVYQQPPSTLSQLAGLATTGLGLNSLLKDSGGIIGGLKDIGTGLGNLFGLKEGGAVDTQRPAGLAELAISKM